MRQRETADRLSAQPGTRAFGAISVSLGAAYRVAGLHKVPASCFHPPPDIESALLQLDRRPDARTLAKRTRSLIRQIFQKRRKQIGSLAKILHYPEMHAWVAQLADLGTPSTARPEVIPVEQWCLLDDLIRDAESE